MDPQNFDWSLGDATNDPGGETTPVGERGAHEATPNEGIDVQGTYFANAAAGDAEQTADDTDGAGEAEAPEEAPAAPELILGKFKSQEALQEAYENLERFSGQRNQEIGSLREELAELRGAVNARPTQTPEPPGMVPDWLETGLSDNPRDTMVWIMENQPHLYDTALNTWAEMGPQATIAAGRFDNLVERERTKFELAQQSEQLREQVAPVAQSYQEQAQQAQFNTAFLTVADKYPAMKDPSFADKMMETAAAAPELAAALQSGDVASKARMVENLYYLTMGRQADNIRDTAAQQGRNAAQQLVDEKLSAGVATGSSTTARGEKTAVESWKEQFLGAPNTSILNGLTEVKRS